ncbi:MAG: YCF48-related protein, partial [Actinomycetes bacterium]
MGRNEEVDGLRQEQKVMTPGGPRHRWILAIRRHWALVTAALVLCGFVVPIIAAAFISTGQPIADRNWYWQQQLPQGNDLRSASWPSATTGYAVGVTGTALKTTDGGTTWVSQDPATTRDLTGVSFVTTSTGWAVGVSGTVIRTTNGGSTWTAQTAPTVPAARNLRAVSFFDANVGVAVGDQGTTTSTIVYTSNGGVTWRTASTTSTVGLSGVQMVSATDGWAVGGAGVILKTTTAGATWLPQTSPTLAGLSAISFAPSSNGSIGYFVGNASLPNWTIYKTTNSGVTWTAVNGLGVTGATNLTGVSCFDANNAVAVGTNGQIRHTIDGGTTWLNQSQNNAGANALRDVKMINAATIKVIGDVGMVFTTSDGGNFWTTPMVGTTATYQTSYFIDANHGWAAGTNGTIIRTTDAGQTWTTLASGITTWRSIHFADANNGWVVGDGGAIQHTIDGGVTWTSQTANSKTTQQLNGVWALSSSTAIAVGNGGTIVKTANGGSTWTIKPSGTLQPINAIWFANSNIGYMVGSAGMIRKSTNGGEAWNDTAGSGTGQILSSVTGVSPTQVWAAGNGGTVVKTADGGITVWTTLATGAGSQPIRTVFFVNAASPVGWFASTFGLVKKSTDGSTWTTQNAGLPTSALDPSTGTWASSFVSTSTGYLFGDSAMIRRTLDGGANWTSQQYGTQNTLNGIAFADSLNGWIFGTGGVMMHTSDGGQTWPLQKTGSNSAFVAQSMATTSTGWGVGDNGSIRRTTDGGYTWTGQSSNTTSNLSAVSTKDGVHAIAAGSGVVKYTSDAGTTWAAASVIPTQPVSGLSSVSATEAWATTLRVAGNNFIWHTTDGGANWASQVTTANAQLWTIHMLNANTGFAAGDSGIILKYSSTPVGGYNWVRQDTPTTLPFYAIRFFDASNGTAVGGGGVVARTTNGGATWALQSSGTARALSGVAYANSGLAFISGPQGTILRGSNLTAPTTTLAIVPSVPNGSNDWYKSAAPTATLTSNRSGTTYYGWTSAGGPFSTYSAPFAAGEGTQTLYYYSVDASGGVETVQSAPIKTDTILPIPSNVVTATAVTTSTASIMWSAGSDSISGVARYDISFVGSATPIASTTTTSVVLSGLTQNTVYQITVATVDAAGNTVSSVPILFTTTHVDTGPFNTVLSVGPSSPNGSNGWYVTTPTVTLSTEPSSTDARMYSGWDYSAGSVPFVGPYSDNPVPATTMPLEQGASTLFFSAHDDSLTRSNEPTRQAAFLVDTSQPASPSVTASATGYSIVNLSWPAVIPPPSGIARYRIYQDGLYLEEVTTPTVDIVGLAQNTAYNYVVYAVSSAGTTSAPSAMAYATTPAALRPSAPDPVLATSPTGSTVYLNWTPQGDMISFANYRIYRRTTTETVYSAVATTTGGVNDCAYIDRNLSSSTRYWYAVSTVDSRGESSLSDTSSLTWDYTAPTTTLPDRILGITATSADSSVLLTWQASTDPSVYGYVVYRGTASMSTMETITPYPAPITEAGYYDSPLPNGNTYYYQVAAVNTSEVVGIPSIEVEAKPVAPLPANQPQPHYEAESACICHAAHSSTSATPLVRFPGSTRSTLCVTCHAPATAASNFIDPLLQSKHPIGASVTTSDPYTCTTCHKPLIPDGDP